MTPFEKGREGVRIAEAQFIRDGGEILAEEVSMKVNGTIVRMDFIGRDSNGVLQFFEVKNGPYARFTPNQKIVLPQMIESKGVMKFPHSTPSLEIIPFGKNASQIIEFQNIIPSQQPYIGNYGINIIHYY